MKPEEIRAFAGRLPKCELHLHYEGAVPMSLVREWSTERIPEAPKWRERNHRYASFEAFGEVMVLTWRGTCNSLERLDASSTVIYQDLFAQNVRYLEMSIGVGAYPYPEDQTLDAFKRGVPDGMTVRIIGGLSRDRDVDLIRAAARGYLAADGLDGWDVHGNEQVGDPVVFLREYEAGRERGMILKAHAGEFGGADSVELVLDTLKVTRIEHGVRGVESADLVRRYVDEGITLDVCPWSNVKLGVWPDLATHPVADLHRAGVRVTVNTDDPTPFGQTITDEYAWLMTERGMTAAEVGEIAKNGFVVADLDDEAKRSGCNEIDSLVAEYAGADK